MFCFSSLWAPSLFTWLQRNRFCSAKDTSVGLVSWAHPGHIAWPPTLQGVRIRAPIKYIKTSEKHRSDPLSFSPPWLIFLCLVCHISVLDYKVPSVSPWKQISCNQTISWVHLSPSRFLVPLELLWYSHLFHVLFKLQTSSPSENLQGLDKFKPCFPFLPTSLKHEELIYPFCDRVVLRAWISLSALIRGSLMCAKDLLVHRQCPPGAGSRERWPVSHGSSTCCPLNLAF